MRSTSNQRSGRGSIFSRLCGLLAACLVLLLFIVAGLPAAALADTAVDFPDAALQAIIRQAINKPAGDIYPSDLQALTVLNAGNAGITDIHGVEYCTNLQTLNLYQNNISDISPLVGLAKLQGLWLYMNQISSISPLAGLSSLTGVYLCYNQISDISPLANLKNLQVLYCSYNQLNDISIVAGLPDLNMINFSGNNLTDITALAGLTNLHGVDLSWNKIDSVAPLVANSGVGASDNIGLVHNLLDISAGSPDLADIETLIGRGAIVTYLPQDAAPVAEYTLTTQVSGSGTVTRSPDQASYAAGSSVNLTATAASGWSFSGWSGDLTGSANPASLTVNADKTVTATFTQPPATTYTLTVNTVGQGTVTKSPDQASYAAGSSVNLTAAAAAGWSFSGWSGDLTGSANPASLTMSADKTVTATFVSNACGLTINIVGQGAVTRSPDKTSYDVGDTVTLTAVPASGWLFDHWSGDLTGSANPASLTFNANKTITATFIQAPYFLTIDVIGQGPLPKNRTSFRTSGAAKSN